VRALNIKTKKQKNIPGQHQLPVRFGVIDGFADGPVIASNKSGNGLRVFFTGHSRQLALRWARRALRDIQQVKYPARRGAPK